MRTLFNILAIVAFTSTTRADLAEYNEDVFQMLGLTDPEDQWSPSFLVNSMLTMEYRLREQQYPSQISFEPESVTNPANEDLNPNCGPFVGIFVAELPQFFCNITSFTISSNTDLRLPQFFRYRFLFACLATGPMDLIVPVMKVPSAVSGYSPDNLWAWANKNLVKLIGPVDRNNLLQAVTINSLMMEFEWLSALLEYGLGRSTENQSIRLPDGTDVAVPSYVTRPVLVSEHTISMCYYIIRLFSQTESVGSNSLMVESSHSESAN